MAITNPCPNADGHQIEPNVRAAAVTSAVFTSRAALAALQVHEGFRRAILELEANPAALAARVYDMPLDNDEKRFLAVWAAAQ